MPIDATIEFDQVSTRRLFSQMERARVELGRGMGQSLRFGGWAIARSLGASTRVSAKKRPVVKNPEIQKRQKVKEGQARYGMEVYNQSGKKTFAPIYGRGELGKIYFTGKHNGLSLMRDKATGEVQRAVLSTSPTSYSKSFVTKSKRRIIKNRGLAKASWMWGVKALGSASGFGGEMTAAAKKTANRFVTTMQRLKGDNPEVRIKNSLPYITDALKGGPQDVSTAMRRAASQMEKVIDANIAKRLKKLEAA